MPSLLLAVSTAVALSMPTPQTAALASSASPPLRLAVAGLSHGHVGGLLANLARLPHVQLVGVAESDTALARTMAQRFGLATDLFHADLASMLDATRPEAVAAFGTTYDHLAVVEACAPRGIHVMVEKPLAVSLDHGRRIAELASAHRIQVVVNYETTWYPSVWETGRVALETRSLGPIRKLVVHDGHPGPREIGVGPEFLRWLVEPRLNGAGALYDFGCYGANLATWLLGNERPRSVTAVTQQLKKDPVYAAVDDESTIVLTYAESQVIIQASWNWPFNRKDMAVYGDAGQVVQHDPTRVTTRIGDAVNDTVAERSLLPFSDSFDMLRAVARGERPADPLSSLENNLIVTEILEAARESAASLRTILLP